MVEITQSARDDAAILRGVGKINGDGWKDKTKIGEVVYVWNAPLEPPYAAGQYPRIGCELWSASIEQYDFTPAGAEDVAGIRAAFAAAEQRGAERQRERDARRARGCPNTWTTELIAQAIRQEPTT